MTLATNAIEINLLSWRQARRQRRSRRFQLVLLLTALVGLAAGYVLFCSYDRQLEAQRQRQRFIQQQTAVLDRNIAAVTRLEARVALLKRRVGVLQSLQAERSLTVHVLNALTESLQGDVYYLALERQDDSLRLSGVALANGGVASQMVALEAVPVFAEPHFSELEASGKGRRFSLSVSQRMPAADTQRGQGAAAP